MNNSGKLFVISAPSGAGKTSLVRSLVKNMSDVVVSISHTTRKMRPGEVDGQDYFFITTEKFKSMAESGEFIEYAQVFDNFYGTSLQSVQKLLDEGLKVILEIDWQGAEQVRKQVENTISIFVLPPSEAELELRLRSRRQDSEDIIARRMRDAKSEICHYKEFDYVIINDNFDRALQELSDFISAPESYLPFSMDKVSYLASDILNRS